MTRICRDMVGHVGTVLQDSKPPFAGEFWEDIKGRVDPGTQFGEFSLSAPKQ
jgi:hypothetical protein